MFNPERSPIKEQPEFEGGAEDREQAEIKKLAALKTQVIEAVGNRDEAGLLESLKDINKILTNGGQGDFSPESDSLAEKLHEFLKDSKEGEAVSLVLYLGDGGLSRIVIHTEEGGNIRLRISENSNQEVKEKWEKSG